MESLFPMIAAAVATAVAATTAFLFWTTGRRRSDLLITSSTDELTAGVRTKLCTIHVQLGEGERWDGKQESLPGVRKYSCQHPHLGDKTEITEWYIGASGKPEKEIYVATKISLEKNELTFVFLDNLVRRVSYNGTNLKQNENPLTFTCRFSVLPSDPNDIKLKKISGNNEYWRTVHRGGTANICVETYDEFGNLSRNEQLLDKIKVTSIEPSGSVRFQPRRIYFSDVGVCTIELECLKVGIVKAQIEFNFGQGNNQLLDVEFYVDYPPLSAEHSRIIREDQDTLAKHAYKAGTDVSFRICLRDIYGNPLQKEERNVDSLDDSDDDKVEVQVLLRDQTNKQLIKMPLLLDVKHASLTPRMSEICVKPTSEEDESDYETEETIYNNSDDLSHKEAKSIVARETEQTEIFQISFTLFVSEKRELEVRLMNEPIPSMPIEITVLPASPKRTTRIRNFEYMDYHNHYFHEEFDSKDEVEQQVAAQQNVWQLLQFTLVDTFGNTSPLGCDEETRIEIRLTDELGEVQTNSLETDGFMPLGEETLQTKYKVKNQGKFQLDLLIKPKITVAPTASLETPKTSIKTPIRSTETSNTSTNVGSPTSVVEEQPENCKYIDLLHLEVVAAMSVEHSKFDISHTFQDVDDVPTIFVDEAVKCKLELRDERGCKYRGPFTIQNLDVYLDGDKMELSPGEQSGGNYPFDLIYGKSGKKTLTVKLRGKAITPECPEAFHIFGIEPYDIRNCELICCGDEDYDTFCAYITSHEVRKGEIIGPDHSRLHNINRVLCGEELEEENIEENMDDTTSEVKMYTNNLTRDQATTVHWLVLSYLRGRHYRQKATEFDEQRQSWKTKSQEAYQAKNRNEAQKCSRIKREFSSLMSNSNKMARDQIFGVYNKDREHEIDLHELLVADEAQLRRFYQQERQRRGEQRANEIVNNARKEQDEAIEKLRERLQQIEKAAENPQWLEVIVGAGHHSREKQKIKPKVEDFLRQQSLNGILPMFKELNEGSLLITFESYDGPEPCFGHYCCKTCKKSWCSQYSWVGKYQCCYRCHKKDNRRSKCYPMKQSKLRQDGYRRRNIPTGSSIPQHSELQELCQKCIELGEYCGW